MNFKYIINLSTRTLFKTTRALSLANANIDL